jgi:hypothetical protein
MGVTQTWSFGEPLHVIFASINSHCPVRDMAQQAPGTVAPEEDESSGSAASFSEQLRKKESD